jgi:hypothetical protein
MLSVGGLSGLQQWLDSQRQLLTADLKARKLRPPRGVLLVVFPVVENLYLQNSLLQPGIFPYTD